MNNAHTFCQFPSLSLTASVASSSLSPKRHTHTHTNEPAHQHSHPLDCCFCCRHRRTMPADLLNPTPEVEAKTHKLKRLVQSPDSFFMDIKCPGCFQITTVFSHAQTVVLCGNCNIMLTQPTGGRARLTEGCSYRKKVD